jgi:CRP/FNR family transcriptional regulator
VLFKQGEDPRGLYILRSGKASLVMKDQNGEEVIHLTVGPGSILGVPAVVAKEPYTLGAKAGVAAEVNFVELRAFEDLMQSEPSLFPLVLAVLAAEVRSARIALTGVMTKLRCRPS